MQRPEGSPGIVSQSDTIPINYLSRLQEVLQQHGFELGPHLAAAGLPADLLDSGVTEVRQLQYYDLIGRLLDSVDIPCLGLKVGQKFSFADYGILGYAWFSCPALGRGIKTFLQYQEIVGSSASFKEELHVDEGTAHLNVYCQRASESVQRFEMEESFGQWTSPSSLVSGSEEFHLSRVDFTFSDPGYRELYQELLGCPAYFKQPVTRISFPAALLDKPMRLADEATSQVCQKQCESILENLKHQGGLVEQVRRIIINQPGQPPSPEDIAGKLNISYRTLRRRLNEAETSVTKILYDVRMSLAQEYLRETQLSLQEIAYLLGYDEVNNFHRAYKKWSGQTAADYRRKHRPLQA